MLCLVLLLLGLSFPLLSLSCTDTHEILFYQPYGCSLDETIVFRPNIGTRIAVRPFYLVKCFVHYFVRDFFGDLKLDIFYPMWVVQLRVPWCRRLGRVLCTFRQTCDTFSGIALQLYSTFLIRRAVQCFASLQVLELRVGDCGLLVRVASSIILDAFQDSTTGIEDLFLIVVGKDMQCASPRRSFYHLKEVPVRIRGCGKLRR